MQEPKWTHKGWLMFCPIKLADTYTGTPVLAARWLVLEPLFTAAEFAQSMVILLCSMFIRDYEPNFYFAVTGELDADNG